MAISKESLAILKTLQALIEKLDNNTALLKAISLRLDKLEKKLTSSSEPPSSTKQHNHHQ
jgi:hypothetical protein